MENSTPSTPAACSIDHKPAHAALAGSDPSLARIQHLIVNSYLVGDREAASWVVVDAGLAPFSARKIIRAAEERFGVGSRPTAIILTHGHFDHVGGLHQLLRYWDVPVYAHELELPYLTGRSAYPPPDPTVGGGLMARMSGLFPRRPIDLGGRVQRLPEDGVVPGLPGWRWVPTPGHSPGHISLFRFTDHLLIAGDAFVTVRQESLLAVLTQHQQVSRPPAYFTPNWQAARASLELLLKLQPDYAATGHGIPMSGHRLREQLQGLIADFDRRAIPARGRYVAQPAVADRDGVVLIPPPVPNAFPKLVWASLAGVMVLAILASGRTHRRSRTVHG
jgi:glyoxylase-like metal-dependent hydrolase (beta-lactamase superfamily II)